MKQSTAILTTTPSDAHSWNLVFMEMFLRERGLRVINLGICVPYELVITESYRFNPCLIVVSTINGLGYIEGITLAKKLCFYKQTSGSKLVIGGKINVEPKQVQSHINDLLNAGFDAVYCKSNALNDFEKTLCFESFPSSTVSKKLMSKHLLKKIYLKSEVKSL